MFGFIVTVGLRSQIQFGGYTRYALLFSDEFSTLAYRNNPILALKLAPAMTSAVSEITMASYPQQTHTST